MNGADMKSWACSRCTLINDARSASCVACQASNPSLPVHLSGFRSNNGLLQKFPLITNTVAKIDSAIDAISSQLNALADRGSGQTTESWMCPRCNQINGNSIRHCSACSFDRHIENKFFAWKCDRCGLQQPGAPLESKCPICRKKTPPSLGHSRSMPELNGITISRDLPTKPAEDDSRECEVVYSNIINFCVANSISFIDDSFPHSNRSIGDLNALDKKGLKISWARPHEIFTKDGQRFRWSIFNDPKPQDIEQGLLGNCWFQGMFISSSLQEGRNKHALISAALALIASRPDILERIFVTKEYSHHGVYQIRLCIDGIWKTVVVDDFFPVHSTKKMMIFGVGRNNQLWVSLIEKALAKIFGSYSRLRGGRMHEGLTILTGYPSINIDIDGHKEDEVFINCTWAQICSALELAYLIGASCGSGRKPVDDREYKGLGLCSQHAYSVLSYATIGDERLLRIRNPHGTFVWSGVYGPMWLKGQPKLRHQLEPKGTEAGTFWMPFREFVKYFDAVDIACISSNGSVVRYPLNIGWNSQKCGCFRLTITESTSISIGLFQKSARSTGHDNIDIMILVHEEDRSRTGYPGKLVLKSERRVADSLNLEGFLTPGTYMVYAHSFSKIIDAFVQTGGFVIHSAKPIHTEVLPASPNVLRKSLQELILKHGRIEKTLNNCVARILTTDFAGIVVMVDNLSSEYALHVQSDCNLSTNIVSSRGHLLAFDSIPPLHRQITTILTHFEGSQAFSISHRMQVRVSNDPRLGSMFQMVPSAQHIPGYVSETVFCLHGPFPVYT